MWKAFLKWLRQADPEPKPGETIYETLLNQLGDIDELTSKDFSAAKTRLFTIRVASAGLEELSELLIDAASVASSLGHFSSSWKTPIAYHSVTLEEFISDGGHLIHPLDWIREHHHYIIKLLDSFMKMDNADIEYYQRKSNFVIEDLLAVIEASRECVR